MQAAYVKALWRLQQDARYAQAFQQESDNARAHLVALLSVSPSTAQKLLVLLSQVVIFSQCVCPYVGERQHPLSMWQTCKKERSFGWTLSLFHHLTCSTALANLGCQVSPAYSATPLYYLRPPGSQT